MSAMSVRPPTTGPTITPVFVPDDPFESDGGDPDSVGVVPGGGTEPDGEGVPPVGSDNSSRVELTHICDR
jgi:hypothetical protein